MIHDVVSAEYRDGYRIEIVFENGRRGTVDFSEYLERGGVFERFRDMDFFRNFSVNRELGVLSWDGQVDIAPETLYAQATGEPLPDWMGEEELVPSDTEPTQTPDRARR
ncbi:MAG: DUF2442 domain-containing protein [Planctomycetota bacterium]